MSHRVIVKNLEFLKATSWKVVRAFALHNFTISVDHVHVFRKGQNSPGKMCVAFVTMANEEQVNLACKRLSGVLVPDLSWKPLQVAKAVPRLTSLQEASHAVRDDPYLISPPDLHASTPALPRSPEPTHAAEVAEDNVSADGSPTSPAVVEDASDMAVESRRGTRKPDSAEDEKPWQRRKRVRNEV